MLTYSCNWSYTIDYLEDLFDSVGAYIGVFIWLLKRPEFLFPAEIQYTIWHQQSVQIVLVWLIFVICFQILMSPMDMPYQCTQCSAKFRYKNNLLKHERKHVGIFQYYCPYCGKGMSATNNLKVHLKSHHTGISAYLCVYCQKDCGTVHQLKQHLSECNLALIKTKLAATTSNVDPAHLGWSPHDIDVFYELFFKKKTVLSYYMLVTSVYIFLLSKNKVLLVMSVCEKCICVLKS